jgi:DNA-binding NarL/FixJ family response regulator
MPRIRVMVVEDQPNVLKSQLKLLQDNPDIQIVATALSGEAALEEIAAARPQVLLCDLGLPRMSGIELTRIVKTRWPSVEVLIFTIFDEEDKVLDAVKAGASGYLLKGTPVERIVDAIKDVTEGGSVIQPNLARKLLKAFHVEEEVTQGVPPVPPAPPPRETTGLRGALTTREIEILRLIAKGLSNSEAARIVGLSRATVRTHLEHIYQKLEVTNRVEAVTEGIRKGLIAVE